MGSALLRPLHRLAYAAYYRLLYGRRFPGSAALHRRIHATGRGDAPAERAAWERQYAAGTWTFMRELDELARYAVIAAYAHHLAPGGAVLDVGCGEGLLVDHLRPLGYRQYLGIDVAAAALAQGAARRDERTELVAADAECYVPPGRFEVVVFNESVYYFRDPVATLGRYEMALAEGGAFIVSTFRTPRADAIVRQLVRRYALREETAVTNRKGTWVVRVLAPRADRYPDGAQSAPYGKSRSAQGALSAPSGGSAEAGSAR
jgi:SAM-dependent methyltransferase